MKSKIKLITMLIAMGILSNGCKNEQIKEEQKEIVSEEIKDNATSLDKNISVETIENNTISENNVEKDAVTIVSENEVKEHIRSLDDIVESLVVVATSNVNIRSEASVDSEKLGVLPKYDFLEYIEDVNEEWYKVKYNNDSAYISKEFSNLDTKQYLPYEFKKVVYGTQDKIIYTKDDEINVPALECYQVYEEFADNYLVSTNDYIGYIDKENVEQLTDTFVVVDISDQEAKLYKDNEIIMTSPVVTGTPTKSGDRQTDEGIFSIFEITKNRYLVGPNYRSYVDVMMKYNKGEGLHDAEYHTCENGFHHGWRSIDEFGGDTYLTDGSHGCVNMPHDAAMFVYDNVKKGTKVLVKK